MRSRVGRLLRHLKEVRDGGGERREGAAQVEGSNAIKGMVEVGIVSRTLGLRVSKCLRTGTQIIQKQGVGGSALVAGILLWLGCGLQVDLRVGRAWIKSGLNTHKRGPVHISLCTGEGSEVSGKGMVAAGLSQPFLEHSAEVRMRSARKNAQPWGCPKVIAKTCLHGFYCRRDFFGTEVVHCAVLNEVKLTA